MEDSPLPVNVDNFVKAETARMLGGIVKQAGGSNRLIHSRKPTSIDEQNVIRMNRDTLYSQGVFDISEGGSVALPDSAGRYMTVMVINEGHYINDVFREPGTHDLSVDVFGTEHVAVFLRTFVDPNDPNDVAKVNALQDQLVVETAATRPYTHPPYSEDDRQKIFNAVVQLATLPDATATFGRKEDVDQVRHLIGTAVGWGGLPESEAFYVADTQPRPAGRYTLTLKEVPVDGFWSLTIYNGDGFMEPNPYDSYSVNNVTAEGDEDGSVIVNLAPEPDGLKNHLYVMDGWNYVLRLYQPRPSVLDGSWTPPTPQPSD